MNTFTPPKLTGAAATARGTIKTGSAFVSSNLDPTLGLYLRFARGTRFDAR